MNFRRPFGQWQTISGILLHAAGDRSSTSRALIECMVGSSDASSSRVDWVGGCSGSEDSGLWNAVRRDSNDGNLILQEWELYIWSGNTVIPAEQERFLGMSQPHPQGLKTNLAARIENDRDSVLHAR